MKLTIDTREDSHEELRKVIQMLQALIGEARTNAPEPDFSPSPALMSMFDEPKFDDKKTKPSYEEEFKILEY